MSLCVVAARYFTHIPQGYFTGDQSGNCISAPLPVISNRVSKQDVISQIISGYPSQKTHYDDVIMETIASQITSLTSVYSTVYAGADQSKHQSSASLAFVWGIHRGPVNSPHKWPVTRKMFPFDDVIMQWCGAFSLLEPWTSLWTHGCVNGCLRRRVAHVTSL